MPLIGSTDRRVLVDVYRITRDTLEARLGDDVWQ